MNTKTLQWVLIGGAIIVIFCYAILLIYLAWPIDEISINKAGSFGDSFGILTSLFSALAFSGMIITILLQKEELGLQRQELADTRREITAQKEILRTQSFNDNFYRLIDYYKDNLSHVVVLDKKNNQQITGVSALKYLLERFSEKQREYKHYYNPHNEDMMKVFEYYLFIDIQNILMKQGRYLRTLQSLLSLVEEQAHDNKSLYWGIIESQLTVHEIKYIFYHTLIDSDGGLGRLVKCSKLIENRAPSSGLPKTHLHVFNQRLGLGVVNKGFDIKKPHRRGEIRRIKRTYTQRQTERNALKENIVSVISELTPP
ncbi:putative phage abortive infection protein [Aeromonas media]|uniref:putative phage abortive infection protein n=1 Tax=Aeromonas media TaxID=651 RepID=UPI000F90C9A3|nr:putative phage abortive infection protein [Aeromonas media]MDX7899163.1 putative phage abortive infection protein [Aeromonas media]